MGSELFYYEDGVRKDQALWDELLGDDELPDDLPTFEEAALDAESNQVMDMPTIQDVAVPGLIGSAIPSKPTKKRKRKAMTWHGLKLSRMPTAFEQRVLSLSDTPVEITAAVQGASDLMQFHRSAQHLADNQAYEDDQTHAGHVLYRLQTEMARYGAFEVDREVARQGLEVGLPLSALDQRYDVVEQQADVDAYLRRMGATAAYALADTWLTAKRRIGARADRSPRKAAARHAAMLSEALPIGLADEAKQAAQRGFAFGRTFRMREIVEARRAVHQLRDDDTDDLVDYVVQTAIQDANLCDKCAELDGQIFEFGSDEQVDAEPPYAECDGRDRCRCAQILVVGDWHDKADVRDAVGSDRMVVATERQAEAMIKQRQRLQADDDDS